MSARRRLPVSFAPTPPDGVLRVEVSLSVDLAELATWPPATARALFIGIAQVISAQELQKEGAMIRNQNGGEAMTDIEAKRAKACIDTLATALRMALREGGKDAKMHVGDCLRVIEEFQRGTMDDGAPITGPFYPPGVH